MESEFIVSATKKSEWPEHDLPEIVVVGRSNVGKSSFINALTNKKKLAYVGNTPGKTRLLNYFKIDGEWMLVDVPGYGYAKLSKAELMKLGRMMDEYFTKNERIHGVVQLIDARHAPTADDVDMMEFFRDMHIPVIIGATKIDKVPKSKRLASLKLIASKLDLPLDDIQPISSTEKTGLKEIEEKIHTHFLTGETPAEKAA